MENINEITKNEIAKVEKYKYKINEKKNHFLFDRETKTYISSLVLNSMYLLNYVTDENPTKSNIKYGASLIFFTVGDIVYELKSTLDLYTEDNSIDQDYIFNQLVSTCSLPTASNLNFTDPIYQDVMFIHVIIACFYFKNVISNELIPVDNLNPFSKAFMKIALYALRLNSKKKIDIINEL